MKKTLQILIITLISFTIYFVLDEFIFREVRSGINERIGQKGLGHILTYTIFVIPLIVASAFMHGWKGALASLGLDKSILRGMLFSLLCCLPMLIGYAIVFPFNGEITLNGILITAVAAAFFEELIFRGFLFGQIYRFTRFGFIPSIIIGALLFGFVHLYQSNDIATMIGVFLTTFLGALLFGWAYVEWKCNLWVPIFLHFFMNLFWDLFSAGETALGGIYSNVFRILTIILIIGVTIVYKKRKGLALEVTRKTIWMKRKDEMTH